MSEWDRFYSEGPIYTEPSKQVIDLVPRLRENDCRVVLDNGCGTGRHSKYLAREGFQVHAIDISERAIQLAKEMGNEGIDYRIGKLSKLTYDDDSMDFVLASHSLEYQTDGDVVKSIAEIDRCLRQGMPFFMRVLSTEHPLYGASPDDIDGFSSAAFCIKNGLPVHFFSEEEISGLFSGYKIERLEHLSHESRHERITVPLTEWVMLAYKK